MQKTAQFNNWIRKLAESQEDYENVAKLIDKDIGTLSEKELLKIYKTIGCHLGTNDIRIYVSETKIVILSPITDQLILLFEKKLKKEKYEFESDITNISIEKALEYLKKHFQIKRSILEKEEKATFQLFEIC